MTYDPEKHHRRAIRLRGYDYASPGVYFVTLCGKGRLGLFATVRNGESDLNPAGWMVRRWWEKIPEKFSTVQLDAFIIMPNHFHGIVVIRNAPAVGADPRVRPNRCAHVGPGEGTHVGVPLHRVVQWFKTMTTNAYIRGVKRQEWRPFPGRLWQRNYWERIVRDDEELHRIRRYITENPLRWQQDKNYPAR